MKRGAKMKLCRKCHNWFPAKRTEYGHHYRLCECCYEDSMKREKGEELRFAKEIR